MKVKTISRNEEQYTRETTKDLFRVYRNYDPQQHPFERAREYTRALVATKMDRMFAKVQGPCPGSSSATPYAAW
jgi:WD repeat and SOF domain-containing protein 1